MKKDFERCITTALRIGWEIMKKQSQQWNIAPKQKSCNINGDNNILCSFFNVKEVGSGGGDGGILLKLLGII